MSGGNSSDDWRRQKLALLQGIDEELERVREMSRHVWELEEQKAILLGKPVPLIVLEKLGKLKH